MTFDSNINILTQLYVIRVQDVFIFRFIWVEYRQIRGQIGFNIPQIAYARSRKANAAEIQNRDHPHKMIPVENQCLLAAAAAKAAAGFDIIPAAVATTDVP